MLNIRSQTAVRISWIILAYKKHMFVKSDITWRWQSFFLDTLGYSKHLKPLNKYKTKIAKDVGSRELSKDEFKYLTAWNDRESEN